MLKKKTMHVRRQHGLVLSREHLCAADAERRFRNDFESIYINRYTAIGTETVLAVLDALEGVLNTG